MLDYVPKRSCIIFIRASMTNYVNVFRYHKYYRSLSIYLIYLNNACLRGLAHIPFQRPCQARLGSHRSQEAYRHYTGTRRPIFHISRMQSETKGAHFTIYRRFLQPWTLDTAVSQTQAQHPRAMVFSAMAWSKPGAHLLSCGQVL